MLTFAYEKYGTTRPIQLQVASYLDGNLAIQMVTLVRHGLAVSTGRQGRSGYCTYPEYRFREKRLREIDADGYENYLQTREKLISY